MDLGGKCVSFEEGFDFVIEEATEDLQDGHGLVSDLEFFPSFFLAHAIEQLRSK